MKESAMDWVATDRSACVADVRRLGLEGAAEYNYSLSCDRAAAGDHRWEGITVEEMREALECLSGK